MSKNEKKSGGMGYARIIGIVLLIFALIAISVFLSSRRSIDADISLLRSIYTNVYEARCECQSTVAKSMSSVAKISLRCMQAYSLCTPEDYPEDLQDFLRVIEKASTGTSVK